ncbi:MAG TPA: hypothetical protein V6C97_01965 [Oculatellaceae cyanobacterium]
MVNVFASGKKKEQPEDQNPQDKQATADAKSGDQPVVAIQKLKLEEAKLADEKHNLLQLREQLKEKINNQIENRKNSVQKLRAEIDELKAECANLNESLQNEALIQ